MQSGIQASIAGSLHLGKPAEIHWLVGHSPLFRVPLWEQMSLSLDEFARGFFLCEPW